MKPSDPSLPSVTGMVTEMFLRVLDGDEEFDLEALCRAHPEHAEEIRRRHEAYQLAMFAAQAVDADGITGTAPAWQAFIDQLASRGPGWTRYREGEELGRGGMGLIRKVYDEDLRRFLAMKRIRRDEADDALLGRFLEEAQVAGQLDHPGIAPVHEMGVDSDGQLYFTMKLVQGEHFGRVLERVREKEEGWSVVRALGLLQRACEALAYAHAKGVIHRDLKPENIMVGRFGETYVMDWGLARILGRADLRDPRPQTDDEEATVQVRSDRRDLSGDVSPLLTMDGEAIGTPYFMAPEQAQGRLEALGPATDVYAMGCILYQLLGGRSPYEVPGSRSTSREVLDQLLSGPPQPLREIQPNVPPELEAICQKAMSRDIVSRYRTMSELAEDLRSFQENRVVKAHATGPLAELKKWVARNRAVAVTSAAAVVVVVVLSTTFVLRLREERNAAEASARDARESKEVAEEINRFLTDDLLSAVAPSADAGRGRDVPMREVLDEAALRIGERFEGRPAVEANIRQTLGSTYRRLGELESADAHVVRALQLVEETVGLEHVDALRTRSELGMLRFDQGRYPEAEELLKGVLESSRRLLGNDDPTTLSFIRNLAVLYRAQNRFEESVKLDEEALDAGFSAGKESAGEALSSMNGLAIVYFRMGEYEKAEALLEECLETAKQLFGENSIETHNQAQNLAGTYIQMGRAEPAEALYRSALAGMREIQGEDHPATLNCAMNLAGLLRMTKRRDEAEQLYTTILETMRLRLGADHSLTLNCTRDLGVLYIDLKRFGDAEPLLVEAVAGLRRVHGERHTSTLAAMSSLAVLLFGSQRAEEAEPLFVDILQARSEMLGDDHPSTLSSLENLAVFYYRQDRLEEAEPLGRELLAKTAEDAPNRELRQKILDLILKKKAE